ncbi:GIY-YIG nuclease family protein [Spongiimicrobium sp. 3-5]|uniref:GIY-YIG nuclease family protein n=1 Tax=Spongiimicrobium sp. 3-5 TaxID=3332596 RepID=UPI00397FEEB0
MINCVYVIYSVGLDRFYVGETLDIEKRIADHNTGFYKGSWTTQTNDWELFLKIACSSRSQARKIEAHIKKMKSSKYIQDLNRYPEIVEKLKNRYN